MLKLNLCCGEIYKEGFINVDKNKRIKADLHLDVTCEKFPYETNSVDEVYFMHGLEHIERRFWDFVLCEIVRVLKPLGRVVFGYPEFRVCATAFIENRGNRRDYWMNALYGRQLWEGDYHVTPVDSPELQLIIESVGFFRVVWAPESNEDYYNSLMIGYKDPEFQHSESVMAGELALGPAVSIKDFN